MTQQEYEQKKRECWGEYVNLLNHNSAARYVFDKIFARAYALGKQTETISQEEIEKAATNYVKTNPFVNSQNATASRESFKDGAKFALGKQEDGAEETAISGWVLVDDTTFQRIVRVHKITQGDYEVVWDSGEPEFYLEEEVFPDMTPDSDPEQVEVIIKRKKK